MKQLFEIDCDGGCIEAEFLRAYLQTEFNSLPQSPARKKRNFTIKVKEITSPLPRRRVLVEIGSEEFEMAVCKIVAGMNQKK